MESIHKPVLLAECLHYLQPPEKKTAPASPVLMVDATLGEGGHSEAFLNMYHNLRIIGLDADAEIQARAKERLGVFGQRMTFSHIWFNDFFANLSRTVAENLSGTRCNEEKPDIILFDLGVSVFHYELSNRGFSFRNDEKLDMRLDDQTLEKSAWDVIVLSTENELADIIYRYGEERYSRRIARALKVHAATVVDMSGSEDASAATSAQKVAEVIWDAVPSAYTHMRLHPATKTFQALRIAVNGELTRLQQVLFDAFDCLAVDGKMGVISFHSLEDRIVKNFFKALSKDCVCPPTVGKCVCGGKKNALLLIKKGVSASAQEISSNGPSRSARLRVLQKVCDMNEKKKELLNTYEKI
ncbi:MAG: 16S rRNA (cytosine(1402)-N(4))-methyltransferase RsmH [Treponemataceae bacterium]|nr:MAG: 16S rRNA (cytosine(1402)-N(4))-methyltransferase RsmH [Treponemataceae bacterium]